MARIAVLGTGFAGFGAWHRLRDEPHDVVMYDKSASAGGHTSSWHFPPGFAFDEGPHISFTKDERVRQILADAVEGEFEEVQYHLNNYWRGHWITHPAQCNLFGLPTDLVARVLSDFVGQSQKPEAPIASYDDWLVQAYGRVFTDEFPERYTQKYHTTSARNLTTDWIGPRMYRPNLDEVLRGALAPAAPNVHYITGFRYPTVGGFMSYLRKWIDAAPIQLGHRVVAIDPGARSVRFANGSVDRYDHLISSVPLPEVIALLPDVPAEVREATSLLAVTGCVLVNVGTRRADISAAHISYFYDEDVVFARLSFPHLMSPHNAPAGAGSVQAEIYFSEKYKPLVGGPEDYIGPVIRDLIRCGVIADADEVIFKGAMLCNYANVIFDHDRTDALDRVHGYLAELGIAWCGRYGDWGHIWTDEAFLSGERAAETVLSQCVPLRRAPATASAE